MGHDNVNSPEHYTQAKTFEVIDLIVAFNLNFQRGSIVKYAARAGIKDPTKEVEDLQKIQKYAEFEIRRLRGEPISDTLRAFIEQEHRARNG